MIAPEHQREPPIGCHAGDAIPLDPRRLYYDADGKFVEIPFCTSNPRRYAYRMDSAATGRLGVTPQVFVRGCDGHRAQARHNTTDRLKRVPHTECG